MKKLIILPLVIWATFMGAQSDRTLTFGWQWGFHENRSYFSGGMDEASGRFHHRPYVGLNVALITRYELSERWYFTSGIGLNTWGFEFAVSDNYKLTKWGTENQGTAFVHTDFTSVELPFMAYLKGKLDCNNRRWVVGAGLSAGIMSKKTVNEFVDPTNEGNSNTTYLTSDINVPGGITGTLRFSAGREKLFKNGTVLHAAITVNLAASDIATATVKYSENGRDYEHQFTNTGRFWGLRFVYYCGKCSTKLGPKL